METKGSEGDTGIPGGMAFWVREVVYARAWGSKRSRQARVGGWRRDKGGPVVRRAAGGAAGRLCRACGPWGGLEALSHREEKPESEQPCDVLSLTCVFKQLGLLCEE